MSSTGEAPQSRRGKIIGGVVAGLVAAALVVGAAVVVIDVRAGQEAQAQLMSAVKVEGKTLAAAAAEDADLSGSAAERTELARLKAIADQRAAELAAQQAAQAAAQAAAEEAARQAAADQAARQAAAEEQSDSGGSATAPNGPIKCPPGSQANSGDGENDTSCFPEICFHITLPDPAHPECEVAFKP